MYLMHNKMGSHASWFIPVQYDVTKQLQRLTLKDSKIY